MQSEARRQSTQLCENELQIWPLLQSALVRQPTHLPSGLHKPLFLQSPATEHWTQMPSLQMFALPVLQSVGAWHAGRHVWVSVLHRSPLVHSASSRHPTQLPTRQCGDAASVQSVSVKHPTQPSVVSHG
jgi:hypothetical protein